MIATVQHKFGAIADLCRRYKVARLYLFGSATGARFDPRRSDLDFVVEMEGRTPTGNYADRLLDFSNALEHLMGRRVDVITAQSIRNPHFRTEIERTRQLIYARSNQEAAA